MSILETLDPLFPNLSAYALGKIQTYNRRRCKQAVFHGPWVKGFSLWQLQRGAGWVSSGWLIPPFVRLCEPMTAVGGRVLGMGAGSQFLHWVGPPPPFEGVHSLSPSLRFQTCSGWGKENKK